MKQKEFLSYLVQALLVALVMFGTARLGYLFTTEQQATAVLIWPPAGIGLAAVLILGRRIWPAIAFGVLAAYLSKGESLVFAIPATIGNTLGPLVGAYLLHRFVGFTNRIQRVTEALGLILFAAFGSTIVSALIGVTALSTSGIQSWAQWPGTLFTWWFGDAMGVVVVAPLLLVWSRLPVLSFAPRRIYEAVALINLLVIGNLLAFGALGVTSGYTYPLAFLAVPLIIWAAVRFGQHGASGASAITVLIAVLYTARGIGPFVHADLYTSLVLVWLFSVVVAVTALVLGATVTERQLAEKMLQVSNRMHLVLSACSSAMSRARSEKQFCSQVCADLIDIGGFRMAWVGIADHGPDKAVHPIAQAGFDAGYLENLEITWADAERGQGPTGTAIRTACPVLARDILNDHLFAPWREAAFERGYESSVALPLIDDDAAIGALNIYAEQPDAFNQQETELLVKVAGELAYGIMSIRAEAARQQAEQARHESKELFRRLVEQSPSGVMVHIDSKIVFANPAAVDMLGAQSADQILGKGILDFHTPESRLVAEQRLEEFLGDGQDDEWGEHILQRLDGEIIRALARGALVTYEGQDAVLLVVHDISDLKRADRALRTSEEKYRTLVTTMGEGIVATELGQDGIVRLSFANPAAEQLFGVGAGELIGMRLASFLDPEQLASAENELNNRRSGKTSTYDLIITRADGVQRNTQITSSPRLDAQGEFVGSFSVMADITERKLAEQALRDSEEHLKALSDASFEAIFLSEKGICLGQNLTAERMFGYTPEEAIGMMGTDWIIPEDRELVMKHMMAGYVEPYKVTALRKDGSTFHCEIQGRMYEYQGRQIRVTALRDITQRQQLEEQLRQSQKLEAIGTLAGGIAHDFNNILFAISGNAELAKELISESDEVYDNLAEIKTATNRATSLVKQLLAFARPSSAASGPQEVGALLVETLKMARATLPSTIKIETQISTPDGYVNADATQLHQVLLNLYTNAHHAMAEAGGTLRTKVYTCQVSKSFLNANPELESDSCVRIDISDTGLGIAPENIERIFEPFFTTREVGKGTGMGLSVAYGLITAMGGAITVESSLGEGTTFSIYLPLVAAPELDDSVSELIVPQQGKEHLLVVDDEPQLVIILTKMLEGIGYRISAFTNSERALIAFSNNPEEFDMLITDMTMPDVPGDMLAKRVKEIRQNLPVAVITGYAQIVSREKASQLGIDAVIQKPIDWIKLAQTVRKLLDDQPHQPA